MPATISSLLFEPRLLVPIMRTARLWGDAVEFAVLQPPEDVLGAVAADAEISGLPAEPNSFSQTALPPPCQPSVIESPRKQQVDTAFLGDLNEAIMAFYPIRISRRGSRCRIVLRFGGEGDDCER